MYIYGATVHPQSCADLMSQSTVTSWDVIVLLAHARTYK